MSIFSSAESGDKSAIAAFIDKGENVNTADAFNRTPLHYASIGGWTEIVSMLLDAGASVTAVTGRGTTPLHYAARSGKLECLPLLIDKGAEINCQDSAFTTPLYTSIQYKEFTTALILLTKYNADPNISVKDISPLALAIKEGAPIELIKSLVEHGAKCKEKDSSGNTVFGKLKPIKPTFKQSNNDSNEMNYDISKLYSIANESSAMQVDGKTENGIDSKDLIQSNKFYSDVTFIVEGQKIQSHKCIVSTRCPSFINLFNNHKNSDQIEIKTTSFNTFILIIEWIYKNKITSLSSKNILNVLSLLSASEQFGINAIIGICENILLKEINESNIAISWEELKKSNYVKLNCPNLIKHCSYLILKNWSSLTTMKLFSEMKISEILDLFKWVTIDTTPEPEPEKSKANVAERKPTTTSSTSNGSGSGGNKSQSSTTKTQTPNKSSSSSNTSDIMDEKNKEKCKGIHSTVSKKKNIYPFLQPVDPIAEGIPDYPNIIKHPMDLSTIKNKLDGNQYKTIKEFASDIRLMFQNALTFNDDNSPIFKLAKQLLQTFNKQFEGVFPNEITPPPQPIVKPHLTGTTSSTTTVTPSKSNTTASSSSTTSTPQDSKKRKTSEPSTQISINKTDTPTKPQQSSLPSSEKKQEFKPEQSTPVKEQSKPEPMFADKSDTIMTESNNNNNNNGDNNNNDIPIKHYTDDEKKLIMETISSLEVDQIKHIFQIVGSAVKQIEENLELDITELSDANLVEIEDYLNSCNKKLKLDFDENGTNEQ